MPAQTNAFILSLKIRSTPPPGVLYTRMLLHHILFYMKGTLRPVHYHVLLDEIAFSPDELQNFIHSLSYV